MAALVPLTKKTMKRNALERALDKVTRREPWYVVTVKDTEESEPRQVGKWRTQKQANTHKNNMVRSGMYHTVEWKLVS